METGIVVVEKVAGKSKVTRCFSKYPLKFIVPNKAVSPKTDAVWIYALSYGGGLVSGDSICCVITVGDDCNAALTTQTSTKVYKSVGSKCSEQFLEARVGHNALLAVLPHPVTCFSTAKYCQKQVFRVFSSSNLLIVDWLTSGRHENGEKWDFELYKSTNHVLGEEDEPLFLDSVLLEQGSYSSISKRMQDYRVIAMVIIMGPQLKHLQAQVQEEVKKNMEAHFYAPGMRRSSDQCQNKPSLIASCSTFGSGSKGLVVRIAAITTESVYDFLRHHLAGMEADLGASPYS